jgi:signal transduction histidine kinase
MTSAIKVRMASFAVAIAMVTLMIGWGAYSTWRQVERLAEKFTRVQIESFQTADQFRANLQQLDSILFQAQLRREPPNWDLFFREMKKLDDWIDAQRPILTTPQEKQVLDQINTAYDGYQNAAHNLQKIESRQNEESLRTGFQKLEGESSQLLSIGYRLVNAHRDSLTQFLVESRQSLFFLRTLMLGALVALLILGALLSTFVYRDMIQPLRMQLVETHAILERHEKLASLGVLAAGVAHEIRNPLTAIKARLFMQQKMLKPGSSEYKDATLIGDEINRLERIVKEVLQFASPADPRLEIIAAHLPLLEAGELLRPQLERNGIDVQMDAKTNAAVRVDAQQMKQVFINLIQNAAESIERNGRILLRVLHREQNLNGQTQEVVCLEVADSGKGMTAEVQKRLFDPFFSTKQTGTGLGLAIAARIVEKHRGALEFQTRPGVGTTFRIILPAVSNCLK